MYETIKSALKRHTRYECGGCPYVQYDDCTQRLAQDALLVIMDKDRMIADLQNWIYQGAKRDRNNGDAHDLLKDEATSPTRYDASIYLCGQCHYAIPRVVNYCPKCGRKVKWE